MNIAFDAYALLGPMSKNRGIGNYAYSQFTGMINRDPDNHYFFFNTVEKDYKLAEHLQKTENFTEDVIDTGDNQLLLRNPEYSEVIGDAVKRYIRENDIDVFYITSPFEAEFTRYKKEWFEGIKVIMTVYDIIPYVMKERYLADHNAYNWYMDCIENLRWADSLFVISQSVKDDMIKYLDFPANQIEVIWGAASDSYREIEISDAEKNELLSRFDITKDFIMCTGGDDDRKNIDGLVRAYGLLPADIRDKYQLVVVCKLSQGKLKTLTDIVESIHCKGDVIFTNFVTDDELLKFYNLASLMAFPSKYEGFGLPITEAWACGTPVLTADNSSLVQIGGDAAVMVDAFDDKSIAEGMKKMLSDENVLKEYVKKGQERLKQFKWDAVNDGIVKIINDKFGSDAKDKKEEKKKIAFFSPLPPIESGISDYSADILSELCNYCDIDVYTDDYEINVEFPQNVQIFNHKDYPANASKYEKTIYQMGNSSFHYYMYPYIRKFGGVVVLHDYNLHSSFHNRCIVGGGVDKEEYGKYVYADYPEDEDYVRRVSEGKAANIFGRELNSFIIDYADTVIVHSKEAERKLIKNDISRKVTVIPSYAVIYPMVDSSVVKEKFNYPKDSTVISAFGGIHSTKRAIPALKAFDRLRKEIPDLRLLFAGKLADDIKDEFNAYIEQNNLKDLVQVTGYISIEDFKEYIDMTDICLNLRYPSNGETSGSLMRIFSRGRCVVVNKIGTFAEFPDEICVKLPSVEELTDEQEIDTIYECLKELVTDTEKRNKVAKAARDYAEKYLDLKVVAKQYYDVIKMPKAASCINEELIAKIRDDKNLNKEDIEGIAETLAYAKGC